MISKLDSSVKTLVLLVITSILFTCNQKDDVMKKGSYGYDAQFLSQHKVQYVELTGSDGLSRIIVVPGWQGRIMTSTASGNNGNSYGWINYQFINEGIVSKQFNVYGGEERFWLGPEGGAYSLYFDQGAEQVFDNWRVPAFIDTDAYPVTEKTNNTVLMQKSSRLINASGTAFNLNVRREVTLLNYDDIERDLGIELSGNVKAVAYQTNNILTNEADSAWTREKGLLSVWMLCMFTPSPTVTVFIPYNENIDLKDVPVVNDEYFGKVPPERLSTENGVIYFKIDGAFRSKIGVPKERAKNICGSYDSAKKMLTVLWYNKPETDSPYVNSNWGEQEDPYNGDVVNSYNDGPVEDGSIMGPFYEIETSSPGAELGIGESITHTQKVFHFEGDNPDLEPIIQELFGLSIEDITSKFNSN